MVLSGSPGLPLAAVREQVAAAVDLVVQVARVPGGRRAVVAVDEVVPLGSEPGDRPLAVRSLATADGLHALPARPPRGPAGPPHPAWLVS
jgi:hypothetical protein